MGKIAFIDVDGHNFPNLAIMKQEFINKWKTWWMFQKQEIELTDAFERELNAIIKQEVENLVKADVSKTKPNVDFQPTEDWTKIII